MQILKQKDSMMACKSQNGSQKNAKFSTAEPLLSKQLLKDI
jgi:hypothetical protein